MRFPHLRGDWNMHLPLLFPPDPDEMVMVPTRQPRSVRHDVAVLLNVDELVVVRADQLDERLKLVGGAIHHDTSVERF